MRYSILYKNNFGKKYLLRSFGFLLFACIISSIIFTKDTYAASTTWTGAVSADWATAGNWSLGAVPTSADSVTIPDASTTNNDPNISAGAAAGSVTIATNGILNGNAQTITVYGNWTNSGTFNHGNGTVKFAGGGSAYYTFTPGSSSYYNLEEDRPYTGNNYDVVFVSGTATVAGNLIHTSGEMSDGQINLAGNYTIGTNAGGGNDNSATVINFNNNVDQSIIYNTGGRGLSIQIDKTGGNLIISDNIVIRSWIYIQGAVMGLDTHRFIFGDFGVSNFTPGSFIYNTIEENKVHTGNDYDVVLVSGTATVTGDFLQTSGEISNGQINLAGNYMIGAGAGGGSPNRNATIINFNNTIDQSIVYVSGGIGADIRTDKSAGTLIVSDDITLRSWTYIQGAVSGLDSHRLIFGDFGASNFTPGNFIYNTIEENKSYTGNDYDTTIVSGTATVSGDFLQTSGRLGAGQINLAGNYMIGAGAGGSRGGGATTIININSAANQSINCSGSGIGAKVLVDKTGGILTISSDFAISGWTYTQGTVSGMDSHVMTFGGNYYETFVPGSLVYGGITINKTYHSGNWDELVVSSGTLNLSGNLTVTAGKFLLNSNNPTVNVSGNVTVSSGAIFSVGTNPISVGGNWINSGTFNHGNGRIIMKGSVLSTFTPGASSYYDLEEYKTNNYSDCNDLHISGTATVLGSFYQTYGELGDGQINLSGNYIVGANSLGSFRTVTPTVLNFVGTGNQTIDSSVGGIAGNIRINKSSGIFTLSNNIVVSGWTYVIGTVSGLDVYTLTLGDDTLGAFSPGALSYGNIELNKDCNSSDWDTLYMTGTATVTGTFTHTNGTTSGGQMNVSGNYTIGAAALGGVRGDGSATVVNMNGTGSQTLTGLGGIGDYVRIDKASGTLTVASHLIVSSWVYVQGTVSGLTSYSLTFGDNIAGTFVPGSLTYSNLTVNKSDHVNTWDQLSVGSGTLTVTSDLTITEGKIYFSNNNTTVNVSGNVTIGTSGVIYAGANPITVGGNWTNAGTFNYGNGSVKFGGATNTVFTPGASGYYNVEINKTAAANDLTISGTAAVVNNLVHTDGELRDGQINVGGNYIIGALADGIVMGYNVPTTVINLNHATNNQQIVYSAGGIGGYVRIDKAGGALTVSNDITVNSWVYIQGTVSGIDTHKLTFGDNCSGYFTPGNLTYKDIEVNRTFESYRALIISGTATVTGDFIYTNGESSGGQIDLGGNYTIGASADGQIGGYSATPTVINFNHPTDNQQVIYNAGGIGQTIRVDKTGGSLTISSDIDVSGWAYIQGNVIGLDSHLLNLKDDSNGYLIPGSMVYSDIEIDRNDDYYYEFNFGAGTVNITGDLSFIDGIMKFNTNNTSINIGGDLTVGSLATVNKGTGILTFNGTAPSTFTDLSVTPQNIGNIAVNKTNTTETQNKLTLASSSTCNTLSIDGTSGQADTLDLGNGGYMLTLANAGSTANVFTVNGTVITGDSTIKYAATNSAGNINIAPTSYDNLELSGTETYALAGTTALTGNLIIGATSILTAGANTLNLAGNLTSSGTFTSGTSTVNLNGTNQSISGNTTFYNLTKDITTSDTLTFAADSTTTINPSGTLTLKGQDRDNRLSLVSSTPDTQWNLAVNDASIYDFDFLDIQDSDATTRHLSVLNSLSGGNNTNWTIINNTATGITIPFIDVAGSTVTIHTTASDTDHDNISLKLEYSIDNGSTWHDPYLSSVISTSDIPTLTNANEYQITGITTASDNTVTILWDTKSEQNELSSILYENDIKIKLTPYDGTDIGSTQTSSPFEVNNRSAVFVPSSKPDLSDTQITSDNNILHFTNLPTDITQIAISTNPDFQETSYQDVTEIIDLSNLNSDTIYLKFRTSQGSTSDTITYNKVSHSTSSDLREGDIVKTKDNFDVYIIKYKNGKQYKRLILSPSVFNSYRHLKWENIRIISQTEIDRYTTSNLVQVAGDQNIYKLFPSGDTGERKVSDISISCDVDSVYEINKTDRDSYLLIP